MVDKFEVTIGKKAILKSPRGRDWYLVFDFMKSEDHTYARVLDELEDEQDEEAVESE